MPEETVGERTEEATPRRREEARERGHVARSVDLSASVVLLGGLLLLYFLTPKLISDLSRLMGVLFENCTAAELSAEELPAYLRLGVSMLSRSLIPYVLALACIALSVNFLQTGFVFSAYPLRLDLEKLNPISGIRRMVSLRGGVRAVISIMKVVVLGAVAYVSFRSEIRRLPSLLEMEIWDVLRYGIRASFFMGARLALALLILGLLDYMYQRWQYEQDIRMTRQEVRDELKRMEGDPLMRERRRAVQRQLALQRMMHRVPEADVVITNPTRIAVAILYMAERMNAPRVVAKGAGHVAERIMGIAKRHRVPIVENRMVAQTLYRNVDVGREIPPEVYVAVAEILAYVYQLEQSKQAVSV